jgi:hypothetical protein
MATAAFLLAPTDGLPHRDDPRHKLEYHRWQKKVSDVIRADCVYGWRVVSTANKCIHSINVFILR